MAAIDLPTEVSDEPSVPTRRWAAVGLSALAIGTGLLSLRFGLTTSTSQGLVPQNIVGTATTFVLNLTLVAVGLILRRNRPEHLMGWLFLVFAATVGTSSLVWAAVYFTGLPGGDQALGRAIAWFGALFTFPTWSFLMTSLIVRFPTGQPESPGEARILRAAAVACTAVGVLAALRPGAFIAYPAYSNPLELPTGLGRLISVGAAAAVAVALGLTLFGLSKMTGRYREASLTGRLQLRWLAFAGSLTLSLGVVFVALDLTLPSDSELRSLAYAVFILAACSVPIAVLQAITRHRLYDIDTIIGRTVAYGALTAILAGVYAASVRGFNALFVALTGQESEATLVLTTLVLATTFTPIKTYLEKLAAKRFPATPDPAAPMTAADPLATTPHDDLDARIEAIARRVAREVLADATKPRAGAGRRAR